MDYANDILDTIVKQLAIHFGEVEESEDRYIDNGEIEETIIVDKQWKVKISVSNNEEHEIT